MDPTPAREHVRAELTARINQVAGRAIPPHLAVRLIFVLDDAEVVYLDAYADPKRDDLTGHVVVYTARHVIVARIDGLPSDPVTDPHGGEVRVSVLPRTALRRIDLTNDGRVRPLDAWTASRSPVNWPGLARVALTYAGLDGPVILPAGAQPEPFDPFLSQLLDDLAPAHPEG